MPFVYSTASAGVTYTDYRRVTRDLNQPVKSVSIAGGSNVAGKNLVTPLGVVTEVSNDDLEFLMKHPVFQRHLEKGFVKVENAKKDPEKVVASGMQLADESAPLTPETLEDGAKLQEKTEDKKPSRRGRRKKAE